MTALGGRSGLNGVEAIWCRKYKTFNCVIVPTERKHGSSHRFTRWSD